MNAWLTKCVFNLDLNRESVFEPRTLSGRLFQSLGAKYEKALPPSFSLIHGTRAVGDVTIKVIWFESLVDFAILGTTKSPEFCSLGSGLDCSMIED